MSSSKTDKYELLNSPEFLKLLGDGVIISGKTKGETDQIHDLLSNYHHFGFHQKFEDFGEYRIALSRSEIIDIGRSDIPGWYQSIHNTSLPEARSYPVLSLQEFLNLMNQSSVNNSYDLY